MFSSFWCLPFMNILDKLSTVDIAFSMAVVSLVIVLIIVLNLFGKNKKLEEEIEIIDVKPVAEPIKIEELKPVPTEQDILVDLKAIENEDALPPAEDEPEVLLDLNSITKSLENQNYNSLSLDKYETEQEEKAIISYEELLKSRNNLKINYETETTADEITIKKVDLGNLTSEAMGEDKKITTPMATMIDYSKEEEFLKALKELQNLLS